VEKSALEKAEDECYEDAWQRAKAREAAAAKRQQHAVLPMRRRQSRSTRPRGIADEWDELAAGRNLYEGALTAAVIAAVRHRHTEYDAMLAAGKDRLLARQEIADRVQTILADWREGQFRVAP
jgi:hypothetical protein